MPSGIEREIEREKDVLDVSTLVSTCLIGRKRASSSESHKISSSRNIHNKDTDYLVEKV